MYLTYLNMKNEHKIMLNRMCVFFHVTFRFKSQNEHNMVDTGRQTVLLYVKITMRFYQKID